MAACLFMLLPSGYPTKTLVAETCFSAYSVYLNREEFGLVSVSRLSSVLINPLVPFTGPCPIEGG
jgi:hypothetical protein